MYRKEVIQSFNVEKLLFEILFVTGAIKIILIKLIISKNRERFSVGRFRVCAHKNVSVDEKKPDSQT